MIDMGCFVKPYRRGVALLSVLLIIMAVTIAAFTYIARSDGELAYGRNLVFREELDLLAQSGLAHAKAIILNMQDVDTGGEEYWKGATAQQLAAGDLFYDVRVERHVLGETAACTYGVTCEAYRLIDGRKAASSTLVGELRLDPCVAFWCGGTSYIGHNTAVHGDIDVRGGINLNGTVNGDAFVQGPITRSVDSHISGQTVINESGVNMPTISPGTFAPGYLLGSTLCYPMVVDANELASLTASPSPANPAGVVYSDKDLVLDAGNTIHGMLVVNGNLRIIGPQNRITAVRGFPALVVQGDLILDNNAELDISGLAVIGNSVQLAEGVGGINVNINGGLYVGGDSALGSSTSSYAITITANHALTALRLWPGASTVMDWSQTGGAFYRNIRH